MIKLIGQLIFGIALVAKVIVLAILGVLFVPLYVLFFRDHFREMPKWLQALTLPVLLVSGRILKFVFKGAGDIGYF